MKITEFNGFWVGYNEVEDFRILISAFTKDDAFEIGEEYRVDSKMQGKFEISEFTDVNMDFDCDYIVD